MYFQIMNIVFTKPSPRVRFRYRFKLWRLKNDATKKSFGEKGNGMEVGVELKVND